MRPLDARCSRCCTLANMKPPLALLAVLVLACWSLAACFWRSYTVECLDPDDALASAECDALAGLVADAQPANQLGDLQTVRVEVLDCDRGARAFFRSELADPNVDRCWLVSLAYAGGDLQRVAYREIGGAIHVP
jgi:hypothetical protein